MVKRLQKLAGILKEDDFDLSDNPFATNKRWTGLKRNQCIMYNLYRSEIDGSDEGLRILNGYAEANANMYFDRYIQDQLDMIKENYLKDPDDFNVDEFLINPSNFEIIKKAEDTYNVKLYAPVTDYGTLYLVFIGDDSPFYKDIIENTNMVNGVLQFNDEYDYEDEFTWNLTNTRNQETKSLPDYFFEEYFEELKDKLAND